MPLKLEVATPVGLKLDTLAEAVTAPGVDGEFTVLPEHRPLLSALRSGLLRYVVGGQVHVAAVGPGFAEAGRDLVRVITERFMAKADVDAQVANQDLAAANKKLSEWPEAHEGAEYEVLRDQIDWAQTRLMLLNTE